MTQGPEGPKGSTIKNKNALLNSASDAAGASNCVYKFEAPDGRSQVASPAEFAKFTRITVDRAKATLAAEARARAKAPRPSGPCPPEIHTQMGRELLAWLKGPLILEKVHHSVAHRIVPANLPAQAHVLLVNHNWAALLKGAALSGDTQDGVRLPYPITVFEFMFVGGVHAVTVAIQQGAQEAQEGPTPDVACSTHFKLKSGWFKANFEVIYDEHGALKHSDPNLDPRNPFLAAYNLITANIFAISVMLEAGVAEASPIREAYKRNRERPIRKELPGLSHHLVSLARRPVPSRSTYPPGEPRSSPRLHFRRAHWRHYANHRTYIKWQLVGNPDLGFVDKDYAL